MSYTCIQMDCPSHTSGSGCSLAIHYPPCKPRGIVFGIFCGLWAHLHQKLSMIGCWGLRSEVPEVRIWVRSHNQFKIPLFMHTSYTLFLIKREVYMHNPKCHMWYSFPDLHCMQNLNCSCPYLWSVLYQCSTVHGILFMYNIGQCLNKMEFHPFCLMPQSPAWSVKPSLLLSGSLEVACMAPTGHYTWLVYQAKMTCFGMPSCHQTVLCSIYLQVYITT